MTDYELRQARALAATILEAGQKLSAMVSPADILLIAAAGIMAEDLLKKINDPRLSEAVAMAREQYHTARLKLEIEAAKIKTNIFTNGRA